MAISSYNEACEILGLKSCDRTASREIKKAFHKKALASHPDHGGKKDDFNRVKDAYDYLMHDTLTSAGSASTSRSTYASSLSKQINVEAIYAFIFAFMCPHDVVIDISIPFYEVYHRKVKKVDIKVKRWSKYGKEYEKKTQSIFIPLNNWRPGANTYVFPNMGDDSVCFGLARSSIRLSINVTDLSSSVKIDDLFKDFSLFVELDISLFSFYFDEMLEIHLSPGVSIKIPNTQTTSYSLKGSGLPFATNRGDIYVKVNTFIPKIESNKMTPAFKMILSEYFSTTSL